MKFFISLFFLCIFSNELIALDLKTLRQSVFKIKVTSQEPDFSAPWKYKKIRRSSGTGFYIGKNQIITNAHVVNYARYISIKRDGDSAYKEAYVSYIAHDCDLAIITTENEGFFKNIPALDLGKVPSLRSPVSVIGFPKGGKQLSVTDGIVSRISYRLYSHSGSRSHLLVQVDSAINSGNSGGPVVQDNKVVGVAFQSFVNAENTGYIIPVPVIKRFLQDIEDGQYDGHPEYGIYTNTNILLNSAAQEYYQISKTKPHGVTVAFVTPWSNLTNYLKKGDVLLEVEGQEIGVDGNIVYKV